MNKPTANQLYKKSKSTLPFKEWLKEKQQNGDLDNHFNANGEKEVKEVKEVKKKSKPTLKKSKEKMIKWNAIAVISVGVVLYGIYKMSQSETESE